MSIQFLRTPFKIGAALGLALLLFAGGPAAAQPDCQAPLPLGDWIINEDCILPEDQVGAENVIVTNNAELTIPADFTLGVGFDNYFLQVQNGSRVVVQNGGRIATYRCPEVDRDLLDLPTVTRYGVTADDLDSDFYGDLQDHGYRPYRLTGYRQGDSLQYFTRWVQDGGAERLSEYDLSRLAFDVRRITLPIEGFRPADVSAYNSPSGEVLFADIWVENSEGLDVQIFVDDDIDDLQERNPHGLAPVRVEVYQDGGETHFVSLWVESDCKWQLEAGLDPGLYQSRVNDYFDIYKIVHVDQYMENGDEFYAAIWWQRSSLDNLQDHIVRDDLDWYLLQRFVNNFWCNGFALTNFYANENPNGVNGVRFGGIWDFNEPLNVTQASSLSLRVQQEINCTDGNGDGTLDGRGGAAIVRINANIGAIEDEIYGHADQVFGASSTIKIAIAYTVLRMIDQDPNDMLNLNTRINVLTQYGNNQGARLAAFQNPTIRFLLQTMIADSNNWATNRLIDCIGSDFTFLPMPIPFQNQQFCDIDQNSIVSANQAIQQDLAPLGITNTQLGRYMVGGPNVQMDYQNGLDVTTTPREITTLLRFLHDGVDANENQLLSTTSYNFLWNTLALDPDDLTTLLGGPPTGGQGGTGFNGKGNIEDQFIFGVNPNFENTFLVPIFNKIGANSWGSWDTFGNPTTTIGTYAHKPQISSHLQRSEAGRLNLDIDGDAITDSFIFYGIYIDEADGPQPAAPTPLQGTISCIGAQAVRDYSGQATTNLLTGATTPCWSP